MTNDAKLGLVLGVAIVLVIGLVFFRTEPTAARTNADTVRAATMAPNPGSSSLTLQRN
jgi:hypothetical protein